MTISRHLIKSGAAAVARTAALAGCARDAARDAAAVATSTSGAIVTTTSTDLGSIIIGWGDAHSDTEITTQARRRHGAVHRPRRPGRRHHRPARLDHSRRPRLPDLTIENTDQNLAAADIDTTNQFLDTLTAVDWSETDQLDIAATADAPAEWPRTHSGRIQVSIAADYR